MAQTKKTGGTKGTKPSASAKKNSAKQGTATSAKTKNVRAHRQVSAIVLFTAAILWLCVSLIPGSNLWEMIRQLILGLFGMGVYFWPLALVYIAVICALDKPFGKIRYKLLQASGLLCLICGAVFILNNDIGKNYLSDIGSAYLSMSPVNGGAVGALIGGAFLRLFGVVPAAIVVLLLAFVFLMLTTGTTLIALFRMIWSPVRKMEHRAIEKMDKSIEEHSVRRFNIDVPVDDKGINTDEISAPQIYKKKKIPRAAFDIPVDENPPESQAPSFSDIVIEEVPAQAEHQMNLATGEKTPLEELIKSAAVPAAITPQKVTEKAEKKNIENNDIHKDIDTAQEGEVNTYRFPPIDLLKASDNETGGDAGDELKSNAAKLVDTLKSFGVETTIIGISRGPAVTRYELKPASGVKINKITNLADDIALNLAASGVRIEAPIPNKSAVGIEIPNRSTSVVPMRELIESPKFINGKSKLTVALGKDITGNAAVTDLAKMPHLLIAGSTGSGKSVCINSLIVSILYKATPDEVKLLMIDPKVVELGVYNGIPHLLVPVVTDPRKASGALSWAVNEMLNRYKIFADNNVRDLTAYNRMCINFPEKKPLPQVVIIIDELADLMMAAPNEVEDSICRLAQMARAAGMHLVIATQRPSVDVITGIIKANIPSRIAFAVSSQVDSRTILDTSGAEKLLGRGDMLFYPVGEAKPTRVQGCFVTDTEIESIIDFVKNSSSVEECTYDEEIAKEIDRQAAPEKKKGNGNGSGGDSSGEYEDEMLPQAIECVVEMGSASTTLLQRRLRLGYARAARIMDELEERGIVGPSEGSKQRKVLLTKQQWLEMSTRTDENV